MFECINSALQLKDVIKRFSENDMELDGRIDSEDGEEYVRCGKLAELSRKRCAQHIHILCCSLLCCFLLRSVSLWRLQSWPSAGIWAYFYP